MHVSHKTKSVFKILVYVICYIDYKLWMVYQLHIFRIHNLKIFFSYICSFFMRMYLRNLENLFSVHFSILILFDYCCEAQDDMAFYILCLALARPRPRYLFWEELGYNMTFYKRNESMILIWLQERLAPLVQLTVFYFGIFGLWFKLRLVFLIDVLF